jgi:ribosomal protein L40E
MSENLPTGAQNDPKAPWNAQDLCRYCDIDQIRDKAREMVEDPENDTAVDAVMETLTNDVGVCRGCREEDTVDFRDEY